MEGRKLKIGALETNRRESSVTLYKIVNLQRKTEREEKRNMGTKKKMPKNTFTRIAIVSPYISIIILNVNGLNSH